LLERRERADAAADVAEKKVTAVEVDVRGDLDWCVGLRLSDDQGRLEAPVPDLHGEEPRNRLDRAVEGEESGKPDPRGDGFGDEDERKRPGAEGERDGLVEKRKAVNAATMMAAPTLSGSHPPGAELETPSGARSINPLKRIAGIVTA
jgi:hypothetical protein